ncbi:heavy-metal-associated domain-containing protein [Opitutales bacterium]|jgi:copper chaperone CopZ|nr:heavy-metal-associated domain-containing protein [Opitutales bacterium]
MKFQTILLLLSTLLISSQIMIANEDKEEARPEVRLAAAKETLLESSEISLVYVKGLVCPSCAIGIRKNLSKMKGVDKKRFKDGIDMNPETQLVSIALKDGAKLNSKDLIERVEDAGYVAVEEYRLHESHLDALQFKQDATIEVVHHTHK